MRVVILDAQIIEEILNDQKKFLTFSTKIYAPCKKMF